MVMIKKISVEYERIHVEKLFDYFKNIKSVSFNPDINLLKKAFLITPFLITLRDCTINKK